MQKTMQWALQQSRRRRRVVVNTQLSARHAACYTFMTCSAAHVYNAGCSKPAGFARRVPGPAPVANSVFNTEVALLPNRVLFN
jgi:hypothetical protein